MAFYRSSKQSAVLDRPKLNHHDHYNPLENDSVDAALSQSRALIAQVEEAKAKKPKLSQFESELLTAWSTEY